MVPKGVAHCVVLRGMWIRGQACQRATCQRAMLVARRVRSPGNAIAGPRTPGGGAERPLAAYLQKRKKSQGLESRGGHSEWCCKGLHTTPLRFIQSAKFLLRSNSYFPFRSKSAHVFPPRFWCTRAVRTVSASKQTTKQERARTHERGAAGLTLFGVVGHSGEWTSFPLRLRLPGGAPLLAEQGDIATRAPRAHTVHAPHNHHRIVATLWVPSAHPQQPGLAVPLTVYARCTHTCTPRSLYKNTESCPRF